MGRYEPPLSLTPAEWLVIFPFPPNAAVGTGTGSRFPSSLASPTAVGTNNDTDTDPEPGSGSILDDPASELRAKYPVNRYELDTTVKNLDARGLAFQTLALTWFMPLIGPRSFVPIVYMLIFMATNVAIVAVIWKLDPQGTVFASKQISASVAAVFIAFCAATFGQTMATLSYRKSGLDKDTVLTVPVMQLIRWEQLANGRLGLGQPNFPSSARESLPIPGPGSSRDFLAKDETTETAKESFSVYSMDAHPSNACRLLEHVSTDRFCPCKVCLQNLPSEIYYERTIRSLTIVLIRLLAILMTGWTAMVHFGDVFWTETWGLATGLIFVTSNTFICLTFALEKFFHSSTPLTKLATRIYHRATSLALHSFLEVHDMTCCILHHFPHPIPRPYQIQNFLSDFITAI